ncbi:TPA: hypothetical protein DEP58_03070 [Patescibacteria group bacterium]|nr:MAG: hypothetical protein UU98_C0018G0037 [Parcubacteria group bacterium GW2011_GWD2_42_14]HCC05263.1 hypothetical protein [Patescibacteria group bacterium]
MTNVSKRKLQPSHLNKLYTELAKTIVSLDKKSADIFLDELLGDEEKIMIAKRLAAIVMLIEKNSVYRVAQLLLLSPSTVAQLKDKLTTGKYMRIEHMLKRRKKEYADFWNTLEVILRAGMPPQGRGRWKSTINLLNKR